MTADTNVPVGSNQNVPTGASVQKRARDYITKEEVEEFAARHFTIYGRGIKAQDLVSEGLVKHKSAAQRLLKRRKMDGTLFTLKNRKPQVYYPTCLKAKVIESRAKKVPVEPTGEGSIGGPLAEILGLGKERSLFQIFLAARDQPSMIHAIQTHTLLKDPGAYEGVESDGHNTRGPKKHTSRLGKRTVTFTLHMNCRITIDIGCSETPFPMACEADITHFFLFMGQVYDRLLNWLCDPRERLIPPVQEWTLKRCDLNKDVEISGAEQLTLPDVQFWKAERVFRAYVKVLDKEKSIHRIEGMPTFNCSLEEGLEAIVYPYRPVERMVKRVEEICSRLVESLQSLEVHRRQEAEEHKGNDSRPEDPT